VSDYFTIASGTQSYSHSWRKQTSPCRSVQVCCSLLDSTNVLGTPCYWFLFSQFQRVTFYCIVSN